MCVPLLVVLAMIKELLLLLLLRVFLVANKAPPGFERRAYQQRPGE
jgi:hypothetical protein